MRSIVLLNLISQIFAAATKQTDIVIKIANCNPAKGIPCEIIKSTASNSDVAAYLSSKKSGLYSVDDKDVSYETYGDPVPVWDEDALIERNNCYNFATGMVTNTRAQPGTGSLNTSDPLFPSCHVAITGALKDGLILVKKENIGDYSGDNWPCKYMALVLEGVNEKKAGKDFHWYRLMRPNIDPLVLDEEWWHKPGTLRVMKNDFSGKKIPKLGLEASDMGPYKEICGYFKLCGLIR